MAKKSEEKRIKVLKEDYEPKVVTKLKDIVEEQIPVAKKDVSAKKPKVKFDMSLVDKIGEGNATGVDYYDEFTRYRSMLAVRVIEMDVLAFFKLSYAKRDLATQEVREKDVDISKLEPPILDIIGKKGKGSGRVVVANSMGIKKVPVVIIADKEVQIDWWLDRKGLK